MKSVWPPTSAFIAGAPPLKGTSVGLVPSRELSRRHEVKNIEPTPACP
jgi:hypothetical protein